MSTQSRRECFSIQLIESIRRVKYFSTIRQRQIAHQRADPHSPLYDPHKAALYLLSIGDTEEAFWQAFIAVHFGKNLKKGWQCARAVVGALGAQVWTWDRIHRNPETFRTWLSRNQSALWHHRGFGNHRKYISLDAHSPGQTGEAIVSYVNWVNSAGSHTQLIASAQQQAGNSPGAAFATLYRSMRQVSSFGRTALFDYLTLIGKLGLASITPDSPYLKGATGPLRGARLAFLGSPTARSLSTSQIERQVIALGLHLGVGMQEMEDSLCNWQKSPDHFEAFRG